MTFKTLENDRTVSFNLIIIYIFFFVVTEAYALLLDYFF